MDAAAAPILHFGRGYRATGFVLAFVDLFVFTACCTCAVYLWMVIERQIEPSTYLSLWPVIAVFLGSSAALKLYPGVGNHPVEEFRRQALIISLVFLVFGTGTFMFKQGPTYSRAVFLIAWALCVVAVPVARTLTKLLCKRASWFGYPAVIFAKAAAAERVATQLSRNPNLGLRPRAVVSDEPGAPRSVCGVPVIDLAGLTHVLREAGKAPYSLVATEGVSPERLKELLSGPLQAFRHVILIPDLPLPSTLWMTGRDLGGVLGLEVEHRLLDPGRRTLKRGLDLLALTVLLPLFLPVLLVLAIAIRIDSRGPVFVKLRRVGYSGRLFNQLKFRTMVVDSDRVLRETLAGNPELAAEWERTQKLKDDPRLTRVGRWLRRTSIDELPQILNVLVGQMSLVGPRPITTGETARYAELVSLYTKVVPGLTGLWQVSGRNELDYEQRVQLDAYYVRNWSVWLDLYIAIKTVWVVATGRGAY
ncbi:MAG: undecaprenyl-phosphate galactose phosphotransferase WbaP [Planctomycetes bacterium]|nr:undecaprenyl-phosphate galactose phosphotransferase WbaP [Planctomycetota bacterium]